LMSCSDDKELTKASFGPAGRTTSPCFSSASVS
jgi:hypothetical protein